MTVDGVRKRGGRREDKSFSDLINELVSLVVAYVKQEAYEPIRTLGRFVAFGVAGSLLLVFGGVILALAAVRVVQAEAGSHLSGSLTWVPYFAGVLVSGGGAAWAALRITKTGLHK